MSMTIMLSLLGSLLFPDSVGNVWEQKVQVRFWPSTKK
jgi:hypothetical protein